MHERDARADSSGARDKGAARNLGESLLLRPTSMLSRVGGTISSPDIEKF